MSVKATCLSVILLFTFSLSAQEKFEYFQSADSLQKAIDFYDEGEYEKAIALLEMVHPGDTNYLDAHYELCLTYIANENYEKGAELAEEGLEMRVSNEQQYYNLLGTAYDQLDENEKALEVYGKAIERYPMYFSLPFNRAVVHMDDENYPAALADLKRAIELNPYHASSHLVLAKLALNEEKYTQALMSMGYFLMIESKTERAFNNLIYFNEAVSDKIKLESKGLKLSENGDNFKKTDLLVSNYVALRSSYKTPSDIEAPLVKQFHIVFDQISKAKTGDGFWETYYMPFYKKMMKEDLFEAFSYRCLATSGSDKHQKIINKNAKDVSEFTNWAGASLREIHGLHNEGYTPNGKKVKIWFHDNSTAIEAVGSVNAEGNPKGEYNFYYSSGSLSSSGLFSEEGKRTGEWKFYYPNGNLSRTTLYKDGERSGASKEYHENGALYVETIYEEDKLNGLTRVYSNSGLLLRDLTYKKGSLEDSIIYYYPHGAKSGNEPIEKGLYKGLATYYFADGSKKSEINWAEDQRNGAFTNYYPNGEISSKGSYKNNYYDGPFESYFPNGEIASKGDYLEGVQIGDWVFYFYDGTISKKETYDEKGKQNGIEEIYTASGIKTSSYVFAKGELKEFRHFDRAGKIIHEGVRKRGKFWYESFTVDGVKDVEGFYIDDHKQGEWKYYDSNGEITSSENYNDEGELHGEYITYHKPGQKDEIVNYTNDLPDGYSARYYANGKLYSQGYNVKGKAHGKWEYYNPDGSYDMVLFYVDNLLNGPQYYHNEAGELYQIKMLENGVIRKVQSVNADSTVYNTSVIEGAKGNERQLYPNGETVFDLAFTGTIYNGPAVWHYGNGKIETEGSYLNDERHGSWKWYYPNGKLETEGTYHLGERTGQWKGYFEDGTLSYISNYENGELHGEYLSYHFNGKLDSKMNYNQGYRDGKRYFYDYEENIDHIRIYDNGRIIGYSYLDASGKELPVKTLELETGVIVSYFPNGKKSREYSLNKGRFDGVYKEYNKDGTIRYASNFEDGDKIGKEMTYYANGKIYKEREYKDDRLNGETITYYPSGKIMKKENYFNNVLHGIVEEYDQNGKLVKKYNYKGGRLYEEV